MQEVFDKIKQKLYLKADVCNDSITVSDKPLYFDGKEDGLREAIEIVDEVAQDYNDGWIPCSESLPVQDEKAEYYKSVIVTLDDGRVAEGCYRTIDKEWWVDAPDGEHYSEDMTGRVIAWQPLPTSYKKE